MKVLTDAEALRAESAVTGDRGLRKLRDYRGIRIVTPQEFLKYFKASSL